MVGTVAISLSSEGRPHTAAGSSLLLPLPQAPHCSHNSELEDFKSQQHKRRKFRGEPASPNPSPGQFQEGMQGEEEEARDSQVAGLFSALQSTTAFLFYPPNAPHALPRPDPQGRFLTLTTCRVLVMKALRIPSSVASRLNFRGFASTMPGHRVKESPEAVLGTQWIHKPRACQVATVLCLFPKSD